MRNSFQFGSVVRVYRREGDCWRLRYRIGSKQCSDYIGSLRQYPSKASAEKAAEKMRGVLNNVPTDIITVGDLIDRYERDAMPERSTTAASYRSIFRRIGNEWGEMRLDKFSIDMVSVETWLKEMTVIGRHPKPGTKPLVSNLYRAQVKNLLHSLMEHAMKWQAIQTQRNPIELVRLRGTSRAKDLVILTPAQYAALLDDDQLPEVVKVMVQIMAGLGLRVSETLGLCWSDFDFDEQTVQIQRRVVGGVSDDTKTASSKASLPLHDRLIDVLRWWKARVVASKWVFASERGVPYGRDYLRSEYLQPAGERIGVDGLGWHGFRHFYRSMLRETGASLEDQKGLLRHARISTTIDTYGGNDSAERLRPMNQKVVEMLPRRSA